MTKKNLRVIRRYCREVRSWLPCSMRMKRMILADVRENVSAYLEEHPDAGVEALREQFGSPVQIASNYVFDLDMPKLLADLRVRKRIAAAVCAALMAALLLWGICITYSMYQISLISDGYMVGEYVEAGMGE